MKIYEIVCYYKNITNKIAISTELTLSQDKALKELEEFTCRNSNAKLLYTSALSRSFITEDGFVSTIVIHTHNLEINIT